MSREIIFLLDRSSNMAGKEAEVIAEYNAFLLQNGRGDYNVTTVLFDDQYVLLYYCLPIGYAQLYPEQYYVRGCLCVVRCDWPYYNNRQCLPCAAYREQAPQDLSVHQDEWRGQCQPDLYEKNDLGDAGAAAAEVWMGDIFRWLRCTDGVGGGTHTQRHQRCGGQPG